MLKPADELIKEYLSMIRGLRCCIALKIMQYHSRKQIGLKENYSEYSYCYYRVEGRNNYGL